MRQQPLKYDGSNSTVDKNIRCSIGEGKMRNRGNYTYKCGQYSDENVVYIFTALCPKTSILTSICPKTSIMLYFYVQRLQYSLFYVQRLCTFSLLLHHVIIIMPCSTLLPCAIFNFSFLISILLMWSIFVCNCSKFYLLWTLYLPLIASQL